MNPRNRTDWPKLFAELREWISAIPEAHRADDDAICDGCGSTLFLIRGRHSGKFFYTHHGARGCEGARAIFFDTQQAARDAEEVFQ